MRPLYLPCRSGSPSSAPGPGARRRPPRRPQRPDDPVGPRRRPRRADRTTDHRNGVYLADYVLPPRPPGHVPTSRRRCATPTSSSWACRRTASATTLRGVAKHIRPWVPVVSLTKGFELGTAAHEPGGHEELPGHPVAVLTGPNLAKEILAGHAAAAVVAMADESIADRAAALLHHRRFPRLHQRRRVRLRGRRRAEERDRHRRRHGRRPRHRRQHARRGDHPRPGRDHPARRRPRRRARDLPGPRRHGRPHRHVLRARRAATGPSASVGKGKTIEEIIAEMNQVAEGVKACPVGAGARREHGVDMPITDEVVAVCHERSTRADRPDRGDATVDEAGDLRRSRDQRSATWARRGVPRSRPWGAIEPWDGYGRARLVGGGRRPVAHATGRAERPAAAGARGAGAGDGAAGAQRRRPAAPRLLHGRRRGPDRRRDRERLAAAVRGGLQPRRAADGRGPRPTFRGGGHRAAAGRGGRSRSVTAVSCASPSPTTGAAPAAWPGRCRPPTRSARAGSPRREAGVRVEGFDELADDLVAARATLLAGGAAGGRRPGGVSSSASPSWCGWASPPQPWVVEVAGAADGHGPPGAAAGLAVVGRGGCARRGGRDPPGRGRARPRSPTSPRCVARPRPGRAAPGGAAPGESADGAGRGAARLVRRLAVPTAPGRGPASHRLPPAWRGRNVALYGLPVPRGAPCRSPCAGTGDRPALLWDVTGDRGAASRRPGSMPAWSTSAASGEALLAAPPP